ncbi:hypothetical protein MUG91_G2n144 [Manis pentadactyla]|nr:hypothetical protein MUG91_G2n144 [Manis pentadactyla]
MFPKLIAHHALYFSFTSLIKTGVGDGRNGTRIQNFKIFYRLQEIGMQTEIEKNLPRFSVKWEIFFYSMGEDTPLLTDRAETPGLGRSQQIPEQS